MTDNESVDRVVQEIDALCRTCLDRVNLDGGGVSLMTDLGYAGTVWTSDTIALKVEELQFTLGEGPCVDAVRTGSPVLASELVPTHGPVSDRWPAFTPGAVAVGVRAIFGLPLQVGAVKLGALDLYRRAPGPLTPRQLDVAVEAAEAASTVLLKLEPEAGARGDADGKTAYHWAVHQAAGMLTQQLGITVSEALVQLRATAFSEDSSIDDLAADVVARRRRFAPEDE